MAKNIVLCSDGTGNSARKFHGTNVKRLFDAVDRVGRRPQQIAFYDDGVGTQKARVLRVLFGALGIGLSRNIREIYGFLCLNYQPGDRIFLFGFSRGAHTVRAVAGMIARVGVVAASGTVADDGTPVPLSRGELERRVGLAYRVYRECNKPSLLAGLLLWAGAKKPTGFTPQSFRETHAVQHAGEADPGLVPIAFLGVWDTVDAVGAPMPELADLFDVLIWRFRFKDFELSRQVQKGCQALALDDGRQTFHPVLWDESNEPPPAPGEAPRIEQVWFAGMHANVGGGYPRDELALVPLLWMMEKAEACKLKFRKELKDAYRAAADAHGTMYNSRAGLAAYYRYKPRYLGMLSRGEGPERVAVAGATGAVATLRRIVIHDSVFERARQRVTPYAPVAVPVVRSYVGEDRDPASLDGLQPHDLGAPMEQVRDLCWWRQVHYYAFLLLTFAVLLIGFRPHWLGVALDGVEWPWLYEKVREIDTLIPAVLDQPVETYARRPTILLALLLVGGALYLFNRWVRRRIDAESDYAWRRSFGFAMEDSPPESTWLHEVARGIRTSETAELWQRFTKRWWPWIATGLVAAALAWGLVSLI